MTYPFPERALKKWISLYLTPPQEGDNLYIFDYHGSTCRNGGDEFRALFKVRVDKDRVMINPEIEIPPEEQPRADRMCAQGYLTYRGPEGESLEEFINRDLPQNFAGCLCTSAQINHKWRMVASALLYYLEEGAA